MIVIRRSKVRVCGVRDCHRRAPWSVTRIAATMPRRVCEDHARVLASRPNVVWDRTGEPARTMPGRSPLYHGGPHVTALHVTANPARGRWRTRA